MNKKIFIIILIAGFALVFNFYWKNLRGIKPALFPLFKNIFEISDKTNLLLTLPKGFKISVFAKDLINPRVMIYDPMGNIIVSIPSRGKVVALPDKNSDGIADKVITVVEGLNRPHGLAARCTEKCELYIAETDKVAVYDYDPKNFKVINKRKIIDLPSGGNHFTRTILFLSEPNDHKLLTSIGSSCNVCEEDDWHRAKILISNADGSDLKTFAFGLRNSVFMAIHPATREVWATEMGRDFLGDNLPPDEINIIKNGGWYGWP